MNKKRIIKLNIIKIIIMVFLLTNMIFCVVGCSFGGTDYDSSAISVAQQIVKKELKNPSSAQFNEVKIELKDDYRRYIVYVDVSAQNGFGGYTREEYYVGLRLAEDGETYWYFPNTPYISAGYITPETAKNLFFSDWGQEPTA